MIYMTREDLEKQEKETLAPYAVFSANSKGRRYPEENDKFRTLFQRDKGRVIHCESFRRMEYKTQVFVNHEGDHYRTRLTHTLEVAQISRSVAKTLRLNEDLVETLVLAHDLGHTPFGHAGEEKMCELMKDHGGFDHNGQSLRVVDVLEKRSPEYDGLNLTHEVKEGIIKHTTDYDRSSVPAEYEPELNPSLEAQLIDATDELAFTNHDIDDGLVSGLLSCDEMRKSLSLWDEAMKVAQLHYHTDNQKIVQRRAVSQIITWQIHDLVKTTTDNLVQYAIQTYRDVVNAPKKIVTFSDDMIAMNRKLKEYLYANMYKHYRVIRMEEKAFRIIEGLYQAYHKRPEQLPGKIREHISRFGLERAICDYISGMTDRYAIDEYEKLFNPKVRV